MNVPPFALPMLLLSVHSSHAAEKPPIYLWLEPEWFDGVKGTFAYWTGDAKPTGSWGIAGPGISAEWTQGGESEWNSMGAPAAETKARVPSRPHRSARRQVPRLGPLRRSSQEDRAVHASHRRRPASPRSSGELGVKPVVPRERRIPALLGLLVRLGRRSMAHSLEGPARVDLVIDKAGEAWRQVDAVLITDDLAIRAASAARSRRSRITRRSTSSRRMARRGAARDCRRPKLHTPQFPAAATSPCGPASIPMPRNGGTMQDPTNSRSTIVFFQFSPPRDIRDKFHKQFAGRKDLPIMSWPHLVPGFYLGSSPDLSPGSPLRAVAGEDEDAVLHHDQLRQRQLHRQDRPRHLRGAHRPAGRAVPRLHSRRGARHRRRRHARQAAGQRPPRARRLLGKQLLKQQAEAWSKIYKTQVPEAHWSKGISCLSVDCIALAHLFHETGAKVVGYEIDATNVHVPMRIAFERGAARQYGGAWINYASGNFGDACNYFTQKPTVPRGAESGSTASTRSPTASASAGIARCTT